VDVNAFLKYQTHEFVGAKHAHNVPKTGAVI
jgi:hypothetical protein